MLGALVAAPAQAGQGAPVTAGPPGGIVPLREAGGHGAPAGKGGSAKPLIYHGGPVMASGADVKAIFWGPQWGDGTNAFSGDKVSGLDSFYTGIGGTTYMRSNIEYTQSNGFATSSAVTYRSHTFDASPTPKTAPSTSAVLAVVANNITNPVSNGYYAVYSDRPRGTAGYCAWHSYGTVRGVTVQFAFFFRLDGDAGCDPQSTVAGRSEGLAAVANVSGHELSEAVTDPLLNAWYDQQGAENADKCAWTFGSNVDFTNGTSWRIQRNWSNAASGCIQTG